MERSGDRHAWDFYGRDDDLGTANEIRPEEIKAAAGLIRHGVVINLNLPLDQPGPLSHQRPPYVHHVERLDAGRDDRLSDFFPQGSTQWDGLRHIRYRQLGYFGGLSEEDLDTTGRLEVAALVRHGLVGRAVFADVAGYLSREAAALSPGTRYKISPGLLDKVLRWEGVVLLPGDILLVRTGWLAWWLGLSAAERREVGDLQQMAGVGLDPGKEMAEWLWDSGIAAVAADNPALEALPVRREEGFLHYRLVPLLGFLIGELWDLEELARSCGADGQYVGMFVSVPLNLPCGAGSPGNGYFMK